MEQGHKWVPAPGRGCGSHGWSTTAGMCRASGQLWTEERQFCPTLEAPEPLEEHLVAPIFQRAWRARFRVWAPQRTAGQETARVLPRAWKGSCLSHWTPGAPGDLATFAGLGSALCLALGGCGGPGCLLPESPGPFWALHGGSPRYVEPRPHETLQSPG